jgi:hypothetical protein
MDHSMESHLRDRGMNPGLYNYTTDGEAVDFPLYDFSYRLTGFQRYRPNGSKELQNDHLHGKYYASVTPGAVGVFGLESMSFSPTIYLVGGCFKASTLHRLGFTALHVSSVSYRALKPQLNLLGRRYLAVGDNDDEGRQFARRYGGFTSPCDVDEMKDEDVYTMLRENAN